MKKIFKILLFTIIIVILYSLTNLIEIILTKINIDIKLLRGPLTAIIILFRTIFITFWVLGVSYNTFWNKKTLKRKKSLILWILTLTTFFIFINIFLLVIDRTNKLYDYAKKTSFRFDKDGFRIPFSNNDTTIKRPLFLFLGCSFTFGAACLAEESFPYLVSEATKGYSMNAGVCAGGLAQMFLLSEEFIPRYKPDFVVVQYSPWLAQRAINMEAPTYLTKIPVPYISKTKDGKNVISRKVFDFRDFDVKVECKVDKFKRTKRSITDYTHFLFEIGIPLYLHNSYYIVMATTKKILGEIPMPNKDIKEVEQFVYNGIHEVCRQNNSKMIILNLGDIQYTENSHKLIFPDSNIVFAEADSLLLYRLKSPNDYDKEYKHWCFNGHDSVMTDEHPNQKAHKIITEAILNSIPTPSTAEISKQKSDRYGVEESKD
ncbi:MAG: hypothetical protein WC614_01180 [bacterium]